MCDKLNEVEEIKQRLNEIISKNDIDRSDLCTSLESIVADYSHRKDFARCPVMPTSELQGEINKYLGYFRIFIQNEDKSLDLDKDVHINKINLSEAIIRTFKRKMYYRYFHGIDSINELKEVALFSFWLIKLKPFTVLKEGSPIYLSVNEKFSLHLILSMIAYLTQKIGKEFTMPNTWFIQETLYSFKYRDLSKESLMLLTCSIARSYGIDIQL